MAGPEFGSLVAAARTYLDGHDGYAEGREAAADLAGQFGILVEPGLAHERAKWLAFRGRVYRAFDRLDADGACRKVLVNRAGPDGRYCPDPRWFTAAAGRRASDQYRRESEQARETAARYEAVHGRLAALGIMTGNPGNPATHRGPPELRDVRQWERLLAMIPEPAGAAPAGQEW